MLTLTRYQDPILTENVWVSWSETLYSGDEEMLLCGTDDEQTSEDRATQPMDAVG